MPQIVNNNLEITNYFLFSKVINWRVACLIKLWVNYFAKLLIDQARLSLSFSRKLDFEAFLAG